MQVYRLRQYVEPTVEPVTAAEFKLHARVDHSTDDTLIAMLILAARKDCENRIGRPLVQTTFDLWLDDFPSGSDPIRLLMPPLQSITHLKYYDADGVQQTITSANYQLTSGDPALIYPLADETWPDVESDHPQAVNIRIVTGYPLNGSTPTTPEPLKTWVLMRALSLYEQRNPIVTGTIATTLTRHLDGLLDPYTMPEALV